MRRSRGLGHGYKRQVEKYPVEYSVANEERTATAAAATAFIFNFFHIRTMIGAEGCSCIVVAN
ncbi:hypothetical protein ACQ4LD_21090, partial [Sphingobacterium daejeonense]